MKQTAPSYLIDDNKHYHAFAEIVEIKHAGRYAKMHLYFTLNSSFRRAVAKLLEVSDEWLEAGYCEREADVEDNPYNARIKITSASVEDYKLQVSIVLAWVSVQDDLLADMLISQGDGANED